MFSTCQPGISVNPVSTCLLRHDAKDGVHGGGAGGERSARIIGNGRKAFRRLECEWRISAGLLQQDHAGPETSGRGVRGRREARCQGQRPPEQRHVSTIAIDMAVYEKKHRSKSLLSCRAVMRSRSRQQGSSPSHPNSRLSRHKEKTHTAQRQLTVGCCWLTRQLWLPGSSA